MRSGLRCLILLVASPCTLPYHTTTPRPVHLPRSGQAQMRWSQTTAEESAPGFIRATYREPSRRRARAPWKAFVRPRPSPPPAPAPRPSAPQPLPAGWSMVFDPASGQPYYVSPDNRATWERPPAATPTRQPYQRPDPPPYTPQSPQRATRSASEFVVSVSGYGEPQPTHAASPVAAGGGRQMTSAGAEAVLAKWRAANERQARIKREREQSSAAAAARVETADAPPRRKSVVTYRTEGGRNARADARRRRVLRRVLRLRERPVQRCR